MKTWIATFGLGAAVGAVAILAMPKCNPTRKLATQAADKVENAAHRLSNKMTQSCGL